MKRKGASSNKKSRKSDASPSLDLLMGRMMNNIKHLQKEVLFIPDRCAERVIERLKKQGVIYKPVKAEDFDMDADVEESEQRNKGRFPEKEFQE